MTAAAIDDLCRVLKNHFKGKTCIATINRLWRKNKWVADIPGLAQLDESNIQITREYWELATLWSHLRPEQETAVEPYSTENEIVTIRWGGRDYVIDGCKRINHLRRNEINGPHPVLVVTPR